MLANYGRLNIYFMDGVHDKVIERLHHSAGLLGGLWLLHTIGNQSILLVSNQRMLSFVVNHCQIIFVSSKSTISMSM